MGEWYTAGGSKFGDCEGNVWITGWDKVHKVGWGEGWIRDGPELGDQVRHQDYWLSQFLKCRG